MLRSSISAEGGFTFQADINKDLTLTGEVTTHLPSEFILTDRLCIPRRLWIYLIHDVRSDLTINADTFTGWISQAFYRIYILDYAPICSSAFATICLWRDLV